MLEFPTRAPLGRCHHTGPNAALPRLCRCIQAGQMTLRCALPPPPAGDSGAHRGRQLAAARVAQGAGPVRRHALRPTQVRQMGRLRAVEDRQRPFCEADRQVRGVDPATTLLATCELPPSCHSEFWSVHCFSPTSPTSPTKCPARCRRVLPRTEMHSIGSRAPPAGTILAKDRMKVAGLPVMRLREFRASWRNGGCAEPVGTTRTRTLRRFRCTLVSS